MSFVDPDGYHNRSIFEKIDNAIVNTLESIGDFFGSVNWSCSGCICLLFVAIAIIYIISLIV